MRCEKKNAALVRTRSFPGGNVSSARGEVEFDNIGDAQFLQELRTFGLEDSDTGGQTTEGDC